MAKRASKRLGIRDLRALPPNSEIWDASVKGFGARRRSGTAVTFVLMYRTVEGRQRWYTIGRLGSPWTTETAREEAKRLVGDVHYGLDPAMDKRAKRGATTLNELCDQYMRDAEAGRLIGRRGEPKKPSTIAVDKGMIAGHIKPLLGSRTVASITRRDVEAFMHAVAAGKTARTAKGKPRGVSRIRGGKGAATRTVGLLGAIMSYAFGHGLIEVNPCSKVRRFADGRRERRLADDEYLKLGAGLKGAKGSVWPPAIACIRFLTLTGWRSGEARALRWRHVDLARRVAILPDTKSGRSVRPLSHAACDVLRGMGRGLDDALVFPATRGDGLIAIKKHASRIIARAGLTGVSPHTLRHSFASVAADLGLSEPTIGALIGHKGHSVTSRYMHGADAVLLAAADQVAGRIAELMGGPSASATIVELRPTPRA
jgi:integrase